MNKESLFEALGEVNEEYVRDAKLPYRKIRMRPLAWISAAALATIVIISGIGIYTSYNNNTIQLSEASRGVTVRNYSGKAPIQEASSLVPLTEEEIFESYDTVIVRGVVIGTRNIVVDFNGSLNYRAIATIQVNKTFRGDCPEVVEVLVPFALFESHAYSNDMTLAYLKPNTEGIFILYPYDENSIWSENGATLVESDIADYGFLDGSRFAFINTPDGLMFARWAYPSINNISSLDEVEDYIDSMLGR